MMALQQQTREVQRLTECLQHDMEEQGEINKRKHCTIIHGIQEQTHVNSDERKKEDENKLLDLFHQIRRDDVLVVACIRLGKQRDEPSAVAHPVKLILKSEEQKDKRVRNKNMRWNRNGLDKEFTHQDLTPRQRETRRRSVNELKDRQLKGELNIQIVGEKIVVIRTKMQSVENHSSASTPTPAV